MSLDSSIGTSTSYGLDGRGSICDGNREYSLLHSVQTSSRAHPAFYAMDTGGSLSGVKRPEHEAHHSPPSSTEVKNGGATPPLPHMFHDVVLN
jgi:hypothetical protein